MPNWVNNHLTFEGKPEDIKKIFERHLVMDEGIKCFDFNTIEQMPGKLNIEKSSKSADGLRLYIAKINPLIYTIGNTNDKILPFKDFIDKLVEVFGYNIVTDSKNYILKNSAIKEYKEKYKDEFDKVVELGSQVFYNMEHYDAPDWYDWRCKHWGTKWNACDTYVGENCLTFDTAWAPALPVVRKLAELYPSVTMTFEYAEEQMGFYCGRFKFRDGIEIVSDPFKDYSKEAYEMSFKLWGEDDHYKYNPETETYEYHDEDEEEKTDENTSENEVEI